MTQRDKKKRLSRAEYAAKFTDEEKIAYFERVVRDAKAAGNYAKAEDYRIRLANLKDRIERDKLWEKRRLEAQRISDAFLNF